MTMRRCAITGSALLATALIAACNSPQTVGDPVAESTTTQRSIAAAPPPEPPAPPSDEDQIRQTIRAFQDAANTQNWDAYKQQMCPEMREKFTDGPVMDLLKKSRAQAGITNVRVTAVDIDGDIAIVTLDSQNESQGSATPTMRLRRVDGWKICVLQ
ncbi:nuclear transport factor 2 family protein [Mycolicibacter minnesotensis]